MRPPERKEQKEGGNPPQGGPQIPAAAGKVGALVLCPYGQVLPGVSNTRPWGIDLQAVRELRSFHGAVVAAILADLGSDRSGRSAGPRFRQEAAWGSHHHYNKGVHTLLHGLHKDSYHPKTRVHTATIVYMRILIIQIGQPFF